MRWLYPSWLWLQILPLLVLAGSVLAARIRIQRLRRYGNPGVLNLATGNGWHIGGTLLLVLGMAFVSAVLCAPVRQGPPVPTIRFVLDCRFPSGSFRETEREWDRLCRAVILLSEQVPQRRCSVYLSGNPPQLLVPATLDREGMLLMLSGALPLNVTPGVPESSGSRTAPNSLGPGDGVVVVSSRGREEIVQLWSSGSYAGSKVLFLSVQNTSTECGTLAADGNWHWGPQSEAVRACLSEIERADHSRLPLWRRAGLIQLFGFAGFVLLVAESGLPLARTFFCRKEHP